MVLTKLHKILILTILVLVWINLPKFQDNIKDDETLTDEENKSIEKTADFLNISFLRTPMGILSFLIGLIVILVTHETSPPGTIQYAANEIPDEASKTS